VDYIFKDYENLKISVDIMEEIDRTGTGENSDHQIVNLVLTHLYTDIDLANRSVTGKRTKNIALDKNVRDFLRGKKK
jgi:hypothetical protein